MSQRAVNVVGAGLAGPLLAILLARRGLEVTLYERRGDPRRRAVERGRSINLALAARGMAALERAELLEEVRPLLIPMRGRMIHEAAGAIRLDPYGQREHEVNYSVERAALNRLLIEQVARSSDIRLRFEHMGTGLSLERGTLGFRHVSAAREYEVALAPTIATDGAGSALRAALVEQGRVQVSEQRLEHDYKELTIPPRDGRPALDANALHVWPRRGFMLIALPNTDRSFTATLFAARAGADSFATLDSGAAVDVFFARHFPDARSLLPDLEAEFAANPQGQLGTVHAVPWRVGGDVLLLGDAAHAIVPFHGQGMNAAFEDCACLDRLLGELPAGAVGPDWARVFAAFEQERRPNAASIAAMALENYAEMRAGVLEPGFLRRQDWAKRLERLFPDRFIPRYSMVMFHPEIPYLEAQRRGAAQATILAELDAASAGSAELDEVLAGRLIHERLQPLTRLSASAPG